MKKKTLWGVLFTVALLVGVVQLPTAIAASELDDTYKSDDTSDRIIFEDNFDNGLNNWKTDGKVTLEKTNGQHYAQLRGFLDCTPYGSCRLNIAVMQKNITNLTPNKAYRLDVRATGTGQISTNTSSSPLEIKDGSSINMNNLKTYTLSSHTDKNGKLTISILAFDSLLGVDSVTLTD